MRVIVLAVSLRHALGAQDVDDVLVGQRRADGLAERGRVDRHAVADARGQAHRRALSRIST